MCSNKFRSLMGIMLVAATLNLQPIIALAQSYAYNCVATDVAPLEDPSSEFYNKSRPIRSYQRPAEFHIEYAPPSQSMLLSASVPHVAGEGLSPAVLEAGPLLARQHLAFNAVEAAASALAARQGLHYQPLPAVTPNEMVFASQFGDAASAVHAMTLQGQGRPGVIRALDAMLYTITAVLPAAFTRPEFHGESEKLMAAEFYVRFSGGATLPEKSVLWAKRYSTKCGGRRLSEAEVAEMHNRVFLAAEEEKRQSVAGGVQPPLHRDSSDATPFMQKIWPKLNTRWSRLSSPEQQAWVHSTLIGSGLAALAASQWLSEGALFSGAGRLMVGAAGATALAVLSGASVVLFSPPAGADESLEFQLTLEAISRFLSEPQNAQMILQTHPERDSLYQFYETMIRAIN